MHKPSGQVGKTYVDAAADFTREAAGLIDDHRELFFSSYIQNEEAYKHALYRARAKAFPTVQSLDKIPENYIHTYRAIHDPARYKNERHLLYNGMIFLPL